MKTGLWITLVVGIVTVIAFITVHAHQKSDSAANLSETKAETTATPLVRPYCPTRGSATAKVTLVEFLDPECESCGQTFPVVEKLLMQFRGDLRLVVRYMPFHEHSTFAIHVIEAARKQNKYWEALDKIFEKQPEWATHDRPQPLLLLGYMQELGLNIDKLDRFLQAAEYMANIQQDYDDGVQLNVAFTPTFFVNGKMVGGIEYEALQSAVSESLRKGRSLADTPVSNR